MIGLRTNDIMPAYTFTPGIHTHMREFLSPPMAQWCGHTTMLVQLSCSLKLRLPYWMPLLYEDQKLPPLLFSSLSFNVTRS
jgi:hypothetical protein